MIYTRVPLLSNYRRAIILAKTIIFWWFFGGLITLPMIFLSVYNRKVEPNLREKTFPFRTCTIHYSMYWHILRNNWNLRTFTRVIQNNYLICVSKYLNVGSRSQCCFKRYDSISFYSDVKFVVLLFKYKQ